MSTDCILQKFYRAIMVANCTDLYMCIPVKGTPHLNPHGAPGNMQGITDRCGRGCACVHVCVRVWGSTHSCGICIMITDGLLLIWPRHLQLHCCPSSGGCNHIRWSEWLLFSKAGASILWNMNMYALIHHRRLGCNVLLIKLQSGVSKSVSLVDWSYHVNAIH